MGFWVRFFGASAIGLFLFILVSFNAGAYEGTSIGNGGELSGTIKIKGPVPPNKVAKVLHNPDVCGETVEDEAYVVNRANQGVQNVLVSIEGITKGKKRVSTTLALVNQKCRFVPHALAGMPGDFVEVKSNDPVLHNTHLKFGGNTFLNVVMPPGGRNIKKEITQAGIIKVKCDAHTFMNADLYVMESPYFALTDDNGSFRISDIPPGKYKVKIMGEGYLEMEKEVTIGPGEKKSMTADIAPR